MLTVGKRGLLAWPGMRALSRLCHWEWKGGKPIFRPDWEGMGSGGEMRSENEVGLARLGCLPGLLPGGAGELGDIDRIHREGHKREKRAGAGRREGVHHKSWCSQYPLSWP